MTFIGRIIDSIIGIPPGYDTHNDRDRGPYTCQRCVELERLREENRLLRNAFADRALDGVPFRKKKG